MDRGPRGAPLKIGNLFSEIFGKTQNLNFPLIRAPLRKKIVPGPLFIMKKKTTYLCLINFETLCWDISLSANLFFLAHKWLWKHWCWWFFYDIYSLVTKKSIFFTKYQLLKILHEKWENCWTSNFETASELMLHFRVNLKYIYSMNK